MAVAARLLLGCFAAKRTLILARRSGCLTESGPNPFGKLLDHLVGVGGSQTRPWAAEALTLASVIRALVTICTLLRALWIGCILFGAGILPVSAETRRVILLFDERSELPGQ